MNKLPKEMIEDRSITGNQIAEKTITRENLADDVVTGAMDVDSAMSSTSTNPVQNKVVTAKIAEVEESVADRLSLMGGTMTGDLLIEKSNPYVKLRINDFIVGNALDSNKAGSYAITDSNGKVVGIIQAVYAPDGSGKMTIWCRETTATKTISPIIIGSDKDGNGIFTYKNKNVVISVDNVNADANGNIALNALKTTGGTMTGDIIFQSRGIVKSSNSDYLVLSGGRSHGNGWSKSFFGTNLGCSIWLGGNECDYPGVFGVRCSSKDTASNFEVYPDGRAVVNEKNIVRSVNGTNADASGNVTLSAVLPTGSVIAFAGNPSSSPSGYLLCNGAAISRTTYAGLFAVIGTLYGSGDGSTTFNLPNLNDKFIQGSGTAGTSKAAGLPNIMGNIQPVTEYVASSGSGALYNANSSSGYRGTYRNDGNRMIIYFDASRSNSIYGASTTVQPPALTMRFYIKY
jgi:hypothetical protein